MTKYINYSLPIIFMCIIFLKISQEIYTVFKNASLWIYRC